MKEGWYSRSFEAVLQNDTQIEVKVVRFLSLDIDELGAIRYEVIPVNTDAKVVLNRMLMQELKMKIQIGKSVFGKH